MSLNFDCIDTSISSNQSKIERLLVLLLVALSLLVSCSVKIQST